MILFASILGAILATGLLALNPSPTIASAGAQMYKDHQYGYDSNYYQDDNRYGYDNNHQKKSSHTDIQKIKCVNSNINVNGIDITKIPTDDLATAEASNEGLDGASNQNGNGIGDRINFDKNLVNICVNVNQNDQLKVGPPEEPATLTVNKEIFGCSTTDQFSMDCDELSPDSSSWLPCIGSSISTSQFCQRLEINFFDIEVLDDQDTQLQQFEGSTTGTTIQNLPAGTYTVNEIKGTSGFDRLQSLPTVEQNCISRGFDGGGSLATSSDPILTYFICFEYEDEQGNDCSDVTLAAGEDKTCTVKNYISFVRQGD